MKTPHGSQVLPQLFCLGSTFFTGPSSTILLNFLKKYILLSGKWQILCRLFEGSQITKVAWLMYQLRKLEIKKKTKRKRHY
jgi:hypothetical protein